ncbi:MAG: exopolysaccharide biosynthesis polyprenyl glycosylphosphotransferase [Candidatus Latescibacterota bacterium]|jgi:exopolysaccharide biosynthesis polyprenyl glycosylphosphotransferase
MRIDPKFAFKVSLAVVDICIVAGGFVGAYWLRFHIPFFPEPPDSDLTSYIRFSFLIGLVSFATQYSAGLYRLQQPFFSIDDFFSVIKSVTLAHVVAAAIGFAIRGRLPGDVIETYSRIVIAMSWLVGCTLLTLWRLMFDMVLAAFRRRGHALTRVVVVGEDSFGHAFYDLLRTNPELGYLPIGLLDEEDHQAIRQTLETEQIDEMILAAQNTDPSRIMKLMNICQEVHTPFSMVPTLFHVLTSRIQVREVAGVPIFALEERIFLRSSRLLKRSIDLLGACVLLITMIPVWLLTSILIRLESKGSVIYSQERIGKGAKPFRCFKFRSMYQDADAQKEDLAALNEAQGPLFKIRNDPRRTKVGRFIRKFSIDELPQLINVFKGEMSLVGPRPPLPSEVDQYEKWQRKRFEVLPGLTGLAQISGRSDLLFDETLRFDFYYIEHWSPLVDLKIMLKTIPKVILGRGAY